MIRKSLFLILMILCLASLTAAQSPAKFGVGAYAGLSFPALQWDQGSGTEFGLKLRWGPVSFLTLEPYASFVQWGEPDPVDGLAGEPDFDLGIDGSKVTSFGLDVVIGNAVGGMGISPYFVAGVASYKIKNDATLFKHSSIGWSAGLGLGIGFTPNLALDVRGKGMVAPQEGGGSKKAISALIGLNYTLGIGL